MSSTYDGLNRPKTSSYTVDGKSYSYQCNYTSYPDEELASFVTPLGTVTYERDGLNRLKERKQTCGSGTITEGYEYQPNLSNGSYTTQLVKKQTYTAGGETKTLEYVYDANANIRTIKSGTSELASYEYDGLNRLTRENIAGKKTVVYSYDGAGNLTGKKEYAYTTGDVGTPTATKAYTYASGSWGDRLTSYNGESIAYDAAGYPTRYRGYTLTWDYGNLIRYGNTSFTYNDAGIRRKKGETEYFVKGNQILAEKRGSTVIHYYYDDSGVAGFEYGGQKYYYRKNVQGDIIAVLDECGSTRGTYEYDAWGNLIFQSGSELLNINPFRYRGYYYDEETGLYYLNSRYYDPETGRFISPDSLKYLEPTHNNGLNLYAYCGNNPIKYSDPTGYSIVLQFIISLLTFAGYAIVSIWDENVWNDMNSINWNPFNTDENKVMGSTAVSFYKGVPVFRMNGTRSGSFFVIGLANSANTNDLKHEWGHSVAYWMIGPVWGALCYALPSAAKWGGNHWQGNSNYYRRPWEAIADIFGGANTNRNWHNPTTVQDREIAIWYLVVASLFGPFSFLFLI